MSRCTMDRTQRRERARRTLDGYVSGPAAPIQATARALAKVDSAVVIVLVEGISELGHGLADVPIVVNHLRHREAPQQ